MADDLEDNRQGKSASSNEERSGVLSTYLIKVLQLVAAAVAIVVLMAIVAYFVSVAVMDQRSVSSYPINSGTIVNKAEQLAWYENLDTVRFITRDTPPKQVVVKVSLGYEENNLAVQSELIRQRVPLQDLVRHYLSQRTVKELMNEAQVKSELKAAINNMMRKGEVKQIAFNSLNIIDY